MATQFTSSTLSAQYSDDFNENDNYHQILFNNGRALQARELTQLQSIIFKELARFGTNIFKEGAVLNAGGMVCDPAIEWIKVSAVNAGGAFEDIPVDTVFKNPITNVECRVLDVRPRNVDAGFVLDTLYVQYTSSGNATADTTEVTRFGDGEVLFDQSGGGYQITTEIPNATGRGCKFTIGESDFFVMGHFVHANAQSLILSPYTQSATTTVGFKVIQEVVTVNDTTDLFDNANGVVNTASPGADRYRIRLELTTQDRVTDNDTFVFLCNIENSKIVEQIQEIDAYNKINELIAQRTFEESGNYVVEPFKVSVEESTFDCRESSFELIVSPGLAYVNGYRVENSSPTKLLVPRPSATETIANDVIPIVYGNYFIADSNRGLPDLDHSQANLYTGFATGGSEIGTARIRAVEKDGANKRVYVYDVNVDSTASLRDVKSIGTSGTDHFNLVREADGAKLYGTTDNDLIFPTTYPRPESFADITLTKQIHESGLVANGSGVITLATLPVGSSYTDTTLWIVSAANATAIAHTVGTPTNSGRDVQISGLVNGVTYEVLSYVQKTATRKAKTLTSATTSLTVAFDSAAGQYFYEFPYVDVNGDTILTARANGANGRDMDALLTFDDGVRDNYYAKSKFILNADADSVPAALYTKYSYWARSAGGDFFDVTSYGVTPTGNNDSAEPFHYLQDGTKVSTRNFLDFRPDEGSPFSTFDLPRNGTNITADISYYLPRADKLIITQEGELQVLLGQNSRNPQYKPTPDNALELTKILLNGDMRSYDDLRVTPIEHRRYTMADIAKLEAKLDDLEEFTTLSLLELEMKLSAALDSDGNIREESGSNVDDGTDQTNADVNNRDYSASLDPESKLIRPAFDENNVRLVINSSLSQNIVKKGDMVYLNHDSEAWAEQSLASGSVKVNPFGLVDNVGTLKLSPTTDEWKDPQRADRAVPGQNRLGQQQAYLWNNWTWNWTGRTPNDIEAEIASLGTVKNPRVRKRKLLELRERYSSTSTSQTRYGGGRFVSRVVPSETLRQAVGDRIIDVALIPWLRARKIYFHAKGLKPNTRHFPFFNGVSVANWVREETAFLRWSDRTDDKYPITRFDETEHPAGPTPLYADANGEIIGSFYIPNPQRGWYINRVQGKSSVRYQASANTWRSGVREFLLLDINECDWAKADSKCFAYYAAVGAIWHHWNNVITTRPWGYWWPLSYWMNFAPAYSTKELRNTLDQITAAGMNILNGRLAGVYGPATAGLSVAALSGLDANGQMAQVLSDYIDVDKLHSASSTVTVQSAPQNPMAQTFYVDNQFGVVLTSVQLFFKVKDSGTTPIQIHLRPVIEGRPASNEIVPDSQVVLRPSQVTVVGTDPTLSVVQERPTTFTFEEPIYLKPWTSYAIVVSSQSTEYELFSAQTQQSVLGSTSRIVSTQNSPGALYLPQNGLAWIEAKGQDLMYTLNRAKFDIGGGSLILQNAPLTPVILGNQDQVSQVSTGGPIETFAGTKKVYVHHPMHGFEPGDVAFIDSAGTNADFSGSGIFTTTNLIQQYLEGPHQVDSVDVNGFTYQYDSAGGSLGAETASTRGGGFGTLSRRNAIFNVANPQIETIVPNNTSIDASAKWTEGKAISSTRINAGGRWTQDAQYSRITLGQNIDFETPKGIYNLFAQEANLGAGVASAYIKLDLKTANDYVSPIIDMQRASLILAGFKIDNPSQTPHIINVDETRPTDGTTGSKHITTPVLLEQDAVGIEVRARVNLPAGSEVDMYYRTAGADENIYDKYWTLQPAVNNLPADNSQTYREAQWLPGGQGGALSSFNQAQFKFVMKGTDKAPSVGDLKYRYLAV